MTDLATFFACGGQYPPGSGSVVRRRPCDTCAFKSKGATVRPADVSLDELIIETEFYNSFTCHQATRGRYDACALWHRLQAR